MFSKVVNNIPEALSIYINEIVYTQKNRGIDITTLSLGEAYFDIPILDFKKLDLDKINHYTSSRGLEKLRNKISEYYHKEYGAYFNYKKEIIISTGSKPLIFMALKAILNRKDEVIILEPAWLSYKEQIKLCGGETKFIKFTDGINKIKKSISKKTKMIILNNPNNPSGKIYTKKEIQEIYNLCLKKKIWLLVDEAYSDFIESNFFSAIKCDKKKRNLIVVNSLSKNMGISGWRIGYIISNEDLIEQILKLNQHIITCAPSILMYYLSEYFDEIIKITKPQINFLLKKRQEISKILDENKIKYLKGKTTFYFFIDLRDYKINCLDLCLYLILKEQIAIVLGSAYGVNTEKFLRLSIGTETTERIVLAIKTLKKVLKKKNLKVELDKLMKKFQIKKFKSS